LGIFVFRVPCSVFRKRNTDYGLRITRLSLEDNKLATHLIKL